MDANVVDSVSNGLQKRGYYKEVQREKSADPDIQLVCDDSNIFKWTALVKLAFSVPEQYPLQPPQVRFLTKIFHPNVHFKTGEICFDILKNARSPAWTLQSVCRAIIALMAHPEPDSPLNCVIRVFFSALVISEDSIPWQKCIQTLQQCRRKDELIICCLSISPFCCVREPKRVFNEPSPAAAVVIRGQSE